MSRAGTGGVAVLVVGTLIAVVLPLMATLVAAVLTPRAWARRARWREEHGYRRVCAGGTEVVTTWCVTPSGRRVALRTVPLGEGFYGIATMEGAGGAMILEGTRPDLMVREAATRWHAELAATF